MDIWLERDADLHMAQLMPLPLSVSCFSKIQIGFTFLVPAHPGSPGQRAVKRVCVCVCVNCRQWWACHLAASGVIPCLHWAGVAVGGGYSTERSESYAADTQQTATLDLKHRRRQINPTSPTPTYDSAGCYSPDVVRATLSCLLTVEDCAPILWSQHA